jgi:competence protein ComGC
VVKTCFGFEGDEKATCCKDCKKDGMIDIKHKKCPCGKRPCFGFENDEKPTCCKDCKQDGMIDIKNKKCPCGKRPYFGFEGDEKATCCKDCKQDGMIDIKNKKCKTHMCDIQATKKYRGYCSRCFFFTFPDEKLTRNYKTKENTIVEHIKSKFPDYDWIQDRKVSDGCSLKRPDLYCDFGSHILIIEVDENSHKGYNCEEKRMMELINDLGMRPTIFVRFNPDKYTDEKTNKVIQSPFVVKNETGKLEIKNKKEFDRRIDKLCEKVEYYSEDRGYKLFQVEELYF